MRGIICVKKPVANKYVLHLADIHTALEGAKILQAQKHARSNSAVTELRRSMLAAANSRLMEGIGGAEREYLSVIIHQIPQMTVAQLEGLHSKMANWLLPKK